MQLSTKASPSKDLLNLIYQISIYLERCSPDKSLRESEQPKPLHSSFLPSLVKLKFHNAQDFSLKFKTQRF